MFRGEIDFSEEPVFTRCQVDEREELKKIPKVAGLSSLLKSAMKNPNNFAFIPVKGENNYLVYEERPNGYTVSEYVSTEELIVALLMIEGLTDRIINPMPPEEISASKYRTTE